jgi:hypothetical protein
VYKSRLGAIPLDDVENDLFTLEDTMIKLTSAEAINLELIANHGPEGAACVGSRSILLLLHRRGLVQIEAGRVVVTGEGLDALAEIKKEENRQVIALSDRCRETLGVEVSPVAIETLAKLFAVDSEAEVMFNNRITIEAWRAREAKR